MASGAWRKIDSSARRKRRRGGVNHRDRRHRSHQRASFTPRVASRRTYMRALGRRPRSLAAAAASAARRCLATRPAPSFSELGLLPELCDAAACQQVAQTLPLFLCDRNMKEEALQVRWLLCLLFRLQASPLVVCR